MTESRKWTPLPVFLSYTWSDVAEATRIERALRRRGITVFRDVGIDRFDRITTALAAALDSAGLLLAFYSERYPTRYACQWELTRAFLAARRLGDPMDRVLVVNPEADESHIAPIELTDAVYFTWGRDPDVNGLVDLVARRVAAVGSVPLGGPAPKVDLSRLDPRVLRPRRFVGRYREMWAVHSALHSGLLPAVQKPYAHSAAVLKAPKGMGKSCTAEQYAFLFRDAYPGGVLWLQMVGAEKAAEDSTVTARFAAQLREAAGSRLGAELGGLREDRISAVVGDLLTEAGQDVLIVVDDLPTDLAPAVLDRLIVPSARVHTLLTARVISPDWPVRAVELGGLLDVEAEELFRTEWQELDEAERVVIGGLTRRCGGNPLVLAAAVGELAAAKGTGAAEHFAQRLDAIAAPEVDLLAAQVRQRGRTAQRVLGFAAALAPAPFPAELVTTGLVTADLATPGEVAAALAELARHSLLRRAGDAAAPTWQLHALVADAVRRELGAEFAAGLARVAACAVTARLRIEPGTRHLQLHARELAGHPDVPLDERLTLLRLEAARHEDHGDAPAARDAIREAIRLAGTNGRLDDLLTAARLAVAAEDVEHAGGYAAQAIARARTDSDQQAEYRARFLAATAHDLAGHYHQADEVFHDNPRVPSGGATPPWLAEQERQRVRVAQAAALRLRGRHRDALAVITEVHPQIRREHPGGAHRGPWPAATVELARIRLFNSQVKRARQDARSVVALFTEAGLPRHKVAKEAEAVAAEAQLDLAFTDLNLTDERWRQATDRFGALSIESRRWFGPDNAHTLQLQVRYARALLDCKDREDCLRVLCEVEPRITATLGPEHPLRLRARSTIGSARLGLGQAEHAREILADLLPRQVARLGPAHPDAITTRFALGLATADCGNRREGRALVSQAWRLEGSNHGWLRERALEMMVHVLLVQFPQPVFGLLMRLRRGRSA